MSLAPSAPHDPSPRPAGFTSGMPKLSAILLFLVAGLASAAPALTLPLRETDGWSLEVPVKAGKVLNVDVRRGFTRVERLDRHAAFTFTRTGNTLHVGVRAGTLPGTTSCFKIHTARATAYTLCAAVENSVPAQTFILK